MKWLQNSGFDSLGATEEEDENTKMAGPSNPYLARISPNENLDTSSVYSKDPPGEDSGSIAMGEVHRGQPAQYFHDEVDEQNVPRRHTTKFRNPFSGFCCCCSSWTNREKVLLSVVIFNTILIIILLGSNLVILRNSKVRITEEQSMASRNGDIVHWGSSWDCGPTNNGNPSSPSNPSAGASPFNPYGGVTPPNASGSTSPYTGSAPGLSSSPENHVPIGDPDSFCGCSACTDSVWNNPAGEFTCGQRISYLASAQPWLYPTQVHACRRIAFEFPCPCGGCDPSQCSLPTPEFILPGDFVPPTGVTMAPTPIPLNTPMGQRQEDLDLYCFPSPGDRASYTLWGGMVVEIKEDQTKVCGPGNNRFERSTVAVNQAAETLTLKYERGSGSEVRILLPEEQRPFTYGEYSFSVSSVVVKDAAGNIKSNVLPKELILGLFTWDGTEDYAVHENYNHEVDIEVSRWNCDTNSDLQFLVQPPGQPQMHRLFTGDPESTNGKYKQGGQVYSFNWNPAEIEWQTTAGGSDNNRFVLKTEEAIYRNTPDYIQCLPDVGGNMEVRINLWNMLGARQPAGLAATDVVEVVIDEFSFVPSGKTHVPLGGVCSKHCQCEADVALCEDHICTAKE